MTYRVNSIEVPDQDPFKNDAFDRKEVVGFLSELIGRAGGPFVLALDSPWGTGKSVFVKMLKADLSNKNYQCVYFDAWKADHVIDPLVALVASVESAINDSSNKRNLPALESVKKITGIVAKRGAVAAIKTATFGALDLGDEIEGALAELGSETFTDLVGAYKAESELFDRFRIKLEETVESLKVDGKRPTLVFFIDELDRCRPNFAIQLLERIKHLFDLANICFVLSVDKTQLEAVVRSVYGSSINAQEYLRRFFDLEYGLPAGDSIEFTASLLKNFDIDGYFFDKKGEVSIDLVKDREAFVGLFTALADIFDLTLRARERCITRFKIVLDQTSKKHNLHPQLVAFLVVTRAADPVLFKNFVSGEISPFDLWEDIGKRKGGPRFQSSDEGRFLMAFLIAYFPSPDKSREYESQVEFILNTTAGAGREGWSMIYRVVKGERRNSNHRTFKDVAKKIDIASGVNF